jgi:hypothetical protein
VVARSVLTELSGELRSSDVLLQAPDKNLGFLKAQSDILYSLARAIHGLDRNAERQSVRVLNHEL